MDGYNDDGKTDIASMLNSASPTNTQKSGTHIRDLLNQHDQTCKLKTKTCLDRSRFILQFSLCVRRGEQVGTGCKL